VLGRYNLGRTVQIRTGTSSVLVPPRVLCSTRVLQEVPSRAPAYPTRYPAKVTCRHGQYSRVARRSADRPSRSRGQTVRQALGRLYTIVGAGRRCRHVPTGIVRCRHGADRLLLVPTLGRAVLVCTAVPRPAYVGPQKALRGCSEGESAVG
jgi:hypothetical protein